MAVPRILRDWSTVGSTSVSVVWRCDSNVRNVDAFLLYYRPLHNSEKRRRRPPSLDPTQLATLADADLCAAGFSRIRVHRFVPKRSHAVLRDLKSCTDYVLILFAVNQLARSLPSIFFFQTTPSNDGVGTLTRRRPTGPPLCHRLRAFAARIVHVTLNVLLFSYVIVSALLIVVYRDTVYSDLCYILNLTEFSQVICTVSSDEPQEVVLQTAEESSYLVWLYNMLLTL